MATIDEKQAATADWLVRQVRNAKSDRTALWSLTGAVGTGKTTVLRLVQESLRGEGLIPLMVAAPAGEVDSAPIALLEIAGQLQAEHLLNGEASTIGDSSRSWSEKQDAITAVIEAHHQDVVILCDEPTLWYSRPDSLMDDTPEFCAKSLAEWIATRAVCRRIIAGKILDGISVKDHTRVPRIDDGASFLADASRWAMVAPIADALRQSLREPLAFRSLWEIKLMVALAYVKMPSDVARQSTYRSAVHVVLEELLDSLEHGGSKRLFCEALARLSLARTPIDEHAFLTITSFLPAFEQDLIRVCLCDTAQNRICLHPLVRQMVLSRGRDPRRGETNSQWRLQKEARQATHQRLQDEYPLANETTFRNQLESLHHELLGGAAGPMASDIRLRFVEQLHEIGRTLSYAHRDHRRAADIFRLALGLDRNNAYSHHYLAFNLDWLAEEPEEVERHYQEATRIQSGHPWWWSRWIGYLATRGRLREARSEWSRAIDSLSPGEGESDRWLYMSLHRWVARWLLHWADLDFAADVLRSIPSEVAETDKSIQALWDLHNALRVAEEGFAVFPLTVPESEWWSPNGHTGLPLTWKARPLRTWMPARIDSIDDSSGELFLITAKRPMTSSTPLEFSEFKLCQADVEEAANDFSWSDLSEGRFLELAYYGTENEFRIGLHRATEWRDRRLIPLVPPPDRWFERAVRSAWDSTAGAG